MRTDLPRDDLALAAYAVCQGFTIHGHHMDEKPQFDGSGIPANCLSFRLGDHIDVWFTWRGWRAAKRAADNTYQTPHGTGDFHSHLIDALAAAQLIAARGA